MSKLSHTRDKIYKTVARQLHGVVPCWVCGEHVLPAEATLEHILPLSEGGNSHQSNLAISHEVCNNQRHARAKQPESALTQGNMQGNSSDIKAEPGEPSEPAQHAQPSIGLQIQRTAQ